jgi:TatD DNase family protein
MNSNDDLEKIIENAISNDVHKILVPGIDLKTSLEAIKLSEKYEIVFAAIGIHPNDANQWNSSSFKVFQDLSTHPKVKAIGEIGLDFYRDYVKPEKQFAVLSEQLNLADITGLPVIIHSRNSLEKTMSMLFDWKNQIPKRDVYGVFHSFEGNHVQALEITSNNFFVSVGGPITYKNAIDKHELVRKTSLNSLLLETDSPFLAPHPFRGKRNEPANIKLIAEKVSNLSEKPLKLIVQETTKNANSLFAWEH